MTPWTVVRMGSEGKKRRKEENGRKGRRGKPRTDPWAAHWPLGQCVLLRAWDGRGQD